MIDSTITHLLNGYTYIKKHPQLLMTLVLIVIIPVAFLFSGQQFLSAAKDNQERLEMERIGLLHDVFVSFIKTAEFNPQTIQTEIEYIADQNPDLTKFTIAQEDDNTLVIIASLDTASVGETIKDDNSYRISNTNPDESLITPYAEHGIRYWKSYRLVRTDTVDYYIFTETSLAHIDGLFASRIMTAYYWLFAILAVVLILIVRHVRLIDYAYLYSETKRANEMKDMFTNMIAHELRAPLTSMRGYASMVRERNDTSTETKNDVLRIEESASRLILIVSDLLDVARIHSGKLSITNTRTNIQQVITSVIEAMQSSIQEKDISFKREGSLSDIFIQADEKRLYQAFTNLVNNSIKYTKSGAITVAIEERNDRIEIRVKDTGMGISAENQKNLFAPFFRVENSETDQTVGTGLGMWITKQLIELMKGSIAVESIRGVGTHIVVTLPK